MRDLFEAIKRGDHPSWTLNMQIMPVADAITRNPGEHASPSSFGRRQHGERRGVVDDL